VWLRLRFRGFGLGFATHISASFVTGVSSTATRQPQAAVMMTTSSVRETTDLRASMLCWCVSDRLAVRKG
jgi:hypothetical protein